MTSVTGTAGGKNEKTVEMIKKHAATIFVGNPHLLSVQGPILMCSLHTLADHEENCNEIRDEEPSNGDGDDGVESGTGANIDKANECSDSGAEEDRAEWKRR